ncbi:carboxypeptidase Q isoform X5 [Hippopotamus amphibius kiboko]|uniref:carboxypeptidase Q isoform X5 n=1 Tax=Hippopotamus amphibius kiboko TaxID=575201 RepID=UPI002598F0CE|nr:carboxypeptidase Q isoform X5 [Hippopotamus amphibius kiboko]
MCAEDSERGVMAPFLSGGGLGIILGRKPTGKKMKFLLLVLVGVVHLLSLNSGKAIYGNGISQRTFQEIKEEIACYGDVAKAIINLAVYGKAQNRSYERLALLVDTVGPRLSGSKSLEKAIQIMHQNLQEDGLENVHLEPVKIPHWERGEESAVMLEPRIHKMAILGLGSSVGTPPEGITAEVLLVTSFDELQRRAPEARGKIVVYNQPYTNYSRAVQYRVQGAVEAAKVGALASLIRSVASFSIYSPHTGIQEYQDGVPKIPTACITVEDAEMMSRMASRGSRIVIQLKMGARNYPDANSFNTVAEILGSKYPQQIYLGQLHPALTAQGTSSHLPGENWALACACHCAAWPASPLLRVSGSHCHFRTWMRYQTMGPAMRPQEHLKN